MTKTNEQEPNTFTDWLRKIFRGVLNTIGGFLNGLGIKPNMVTLLGLAGNFGAGILMATGHLTWGGLLAMVMGPFDALDGAMARLRGEDGLYGAFIDSTTDRYSEIAIYGGLMVYFIRADQWVGVLLSFLAVTGSIMVSYMRARAEALNFSAKIGLFSRVERYLVLIPGIIFRRPEISLWILAIMTHVTALQRFLYVRRQAMQKSESFSNQEE